MKRMLLEMKGPSSRTINGAARIFSAACVLMFVQMTLALALQSDGSLSTRIKHLARWDSWHYTGIAANGYYSALPRPSHANGDPADIVKDTNVALFPGFPLLTRSVLLTGAEPRIATVLASALALTGFWIYVILFLRRLKVSLPGKVTAVTALLVFPPSFFFAAGYSESLFAAAMLGFLFWCGSGDKKSTWLAILHGFIMTATRPTGIILLAYPLLAAAFQKKTKVRALKRVALIAAASSLGFFLFLLYCQIQFGHFDLYFIRQQAGWGVTFNPLSFVTGIPGLLFPSLVAQLGDLNLESRIASAASAWVLLAVGLLEWRQYEFRKSIDAERLSLLLTGLLFFLLTAASLPRDTMQSMIRYVLPLFVLVVFWVLRFWSFPKDRQTATGLILLLCILGILSLTEQALLLERFSEGLWVG